MSAAKDGSCILMTTKMSSSKGYKRKPKSSARRGAKLLAEEAKLKLETFLYPLVVGAGALTAIATAVGLYLKL
jgi:hypothetical protein